MKTENREIVADLTELYLYIRELQERVIRSPTIDTGTALADVSERLGRYIMTLERADLDQFRIVKQGEAIGK